MSSVLSEVFLNDVGTRFIVTLKEDDIVVPVDSATVKTLNFLKPDSGLVTKSASFTTDGIDGRIEYAVESGFLDELGTWKIQGYVEITSGKFSSSIGEFTVYDKLA